MAVRIGTSGWVYNHWKGILYPAGASQAEMVVYCYFNNDWAGHVLANASTLRQMVR